MNQNIPPLRIKIISKEREKKIAVRKFPVFIGSGTDKNIVPIPGKGIRGKQGVFFIKKGELFYKDNSLTGTKINNELVHKTEKLINKGTNIFQIGDTKLIIENNVGAENTLTGYSQKKNKTVFGVAGGAILLVLLAIVYFMFLKEPLPKQIISYTFSPAAENGKFSSYKKYSIDTVIYDHQIDDEANLTKELVLQNLELNKTDTIDLSKTNSVFFPRDLLKENKYEQNIRATLFVTSPDWPKELSKERILVINSRTRFDTLKSGNIIIKTEILKKVLKCEIKIKNTYLTQIKKIVINPGNGWGKTYTGSKIKQSISEVHFYLPRKKPYTFSVVIYLKDKTKIQKERKIFVVS